MLLSSLGVFTWKGKVTISTLIYISHCYFVYMQKVSYPQRSHCCGLKTCSPVNQGNISTQDRSLRKDNAVVKTRLEMFKESELHPQKSKEHFIILGMNSVGILYSVITRVPIFKVFSRISNSSPGGKWCKTQERVCRTVLRLRNVTTVTDVRKIVWGLYMENF